MQWYVGMSHHEKERNKKMPTPRHKVIHNPIPTSLFLSNLFTVEPPNKGHIGTRHFVLYREVVLSSEVKNVLV